MFRQVRLPGALRSEGREFAALSAASRRDLLRKAGWLRERPVDFVEGSVTALTRFRRYR